ncbi:MAG TPA: Na/Pi symporter, partial [Treponemataceae bacterium]|nr:Na/Pi symporter [Treponemataceae bacterium]
MKIISSLFQLIGSLGFLLYGMKLMSDGIQKSAGKSLHKVLGLMTSNRFFALLTGVFITTIIQSSSATTVMVVSFVNAGLLTLAQSIGVIFGANIGTTITAWIVALFGFKFKIAALAIPVFGIGYILYSIKKLNKKTIGEALMGFGLLFVGLDLLGKVMTFDAEQVLFLQHLTGNGYLSLLAGVLAGLVITMLIHSSSASTAIILTMSYNKLLPWEFAAAMVLGSNIGTTIDAVLASIGTKVNARRAALIHVLFNVIGSVIAIILFKPFLLVVDFIVPGP